MKAVITGGAGFIGSHLTRALHERGTPVCVFDDLSTGRRGNLDGLDVELVEGDVRSPDEVAAVLAGADLVFHLAALRSVPRSVESPRASNSVNVDGTLNVLLAARDAGVRRVVVASSSSVYGDAPGTPCEESRQPAPMSPYAVSKLAAEHHALVAHRLWGLETVALRYFNVFGERQDGSSGYAAVIPKFIRLMSAGVAPPIHGDGSRSRDFTYVDNVVDATLAAGRAEAAAGRAINVGTGEAHTLDELVAVLNEQLGTALAPVYGPPRLGDVRHSLADMSLARELLGYEPRTDWIAGVRQTLEWIEAGPSPQTAGAVRAR